MPPDSPVYVESGVCHDDVRTWYEVPSNVVDLLRETIDPDETFVECLVRLLAERQGTYRQLARENARARPKAEIVRRDAVELRLAQALRVIRDTSSGATAWVARRALQEAGIPDPEDDGVF